MVIAAISMRFWTCCCAQGALVEAAVEEEKRRILEEREEMEKTADEVREGFKKREGMLKVRRVTDALATAVGLFSRHHCAIATI